MNSVFIIFVIKPTSMPGTYPPRTEDMTVPMESRYSHVPVAVAISEPIRLMDSFNRNRGNHVIVLLNEMTHGQ